MKYAKLNNGIQMPIVGLGTWLSKSEDAYNAVLHAIKEGYRHIDTAMVYGNEEAVGKAIKDSGVKREDLFITTKLWNSDQGYETTKAAFALSLEKLGLDYVDLYLIHWHKSYELSIASYKAMVELYKSGKIKAIGVSNFAIHHLNNIISNFDVVPMVNQVETHVALQNHVLHNFCKENGIQLEAYAPLMSRNISELLEDETLLAIAKKYNKTVPHIAIRWLVERDIVVIPKSITPARITTNFNVFDFELDAEDMEQIRKLNKARKLFPEPDNIDF